MSTALVPQRSAASGGQAVLVEGEFPLTRDDLQTIAALIRADAGIHLTEAKASLVYSRLSKRVRQLRLASFGDYCDLLNGPDGVAERREMLSFLTTNFTRFFRENHHFNHLRDTVLPELLRSAKAGGRVRIWSAGCSDGQEPYSLALTLLSLLPDAGRYDIRILASDIDPKMVERGRLGRYDAHAVETVPEPMRHRWFDRVGGDMGHQWQVGDAVKELIAFRELNLLGEWPFRGTFQVIFCRNVVIYFDEETQARVWGRYADALDPAGHLYIGHSERISGPAKSRFDNVGITTYRKTSRHGASGERRTS